MKDVLSKTQVYALRIYILTDMNKESGSLFFQTTLYVLHENYTENF